MQPITIMRNALGTEEGGSGVPLDREKYRESTTFWMENVSIKWTCLLAYCLQRYEVHHQSFRVRFPGHLHTEQLNKWTPDWKAKVLFPLLNFNIYLQATFSILRPCCNVEKYSWRRCGIKFSCKRNTIGKSIFYGAGRPAPWYNACIFVITVIQIGEFSPS